MLHEQGADSPRGEPKSLSAPPRQSCYESVRKAGLSVRRSRANSRTSRCNGRA